MADDMQPMTADVNQLSGRREPPTVAPTSDRLIESAKTEEGQDRSKNSHRPFVMQGASHNDEFVCDPAKVAAGYRGPVSAMAWVIQARAICHQRSDGRNRVRVA